MKKSGKYFLLFFLGTFLFAVLPAQTQNHSADVYFQKHAWARAIKGYEKTAKHNPSLKICSNLGYAYASLRNFPAAEIWYARAARLGGAGFEEKLNYGIALKANGKYDAALEQFQSLMGEASNEQVFNLLNPLKESCLQVKKMSADSITWKIAPVQGINTRASEICPVFFRKGIVFATDRRHGDIIRFTNPATNRNFYDLYYAERFAGTKFQHAAKIKGKLNSHYHDGPISFSPANDKAFLTRSNAGYGKIRKDPKGISHLTIVNFKLVTGKWMRQANLPFLNVNYSIQHLSFSQDEKMVCFSSDMPGSFGGFDLYISRWNDETQSWGDPENLGPRVNTSSNEGYPAIVEDSVLFFASDRQTGFGGLDIYFSACIGKIWSKATNAGPVVNSAADDFSLILDPKSGTGFFTSNRMGGKGDDDIYSFRRLKILEAVVTDSRSHEVLPGVVVDVLDVNQKKYTYTTDEYGKIRHYVSSGEDFIVAVKMNGFEDLRQAVDLKGTNGSGIKTTVLALLPDRKWVLRGTVTDMQTEYPLEGASIRLIGKDDDHIKSGRGGLYQYQLNPESEYTVIIAEPGYIPVIKKVSTLTDPSPKDYRIDGVLKKGNFLWVEGLAMDDEKGKVIDSVNIRILDQNSQKEVYSTFSRPDGIFFAVLEPGNYSVVASKRNYFSTHFDLQSNPLLSDTANANLKLIPLGEDKVVKTIYHEYKKTEFDAQSERELNEIVYFLNENPDVIVEISAHTDSRGGDPYNLSLSQKRAEKVAAYLIYKGIFSGRIIAKGYGESRLVNKCGNGAGCSEFLHSRNRRTELKVIRIRPTGQPFPNGGK